MAETTEPEANQKQTNQTVHELPGAFDLLKPSWNAVKLNLITLIEFIIIPILISLISGIVLYQHSSATSTVFNGTSIVIDLFTVVVSLMFGPGLTYTLICGAKGRSIDFWPAFRVGLKFFWRYLGVSICTGFLILIGFICLIVPGIYMLRRYFLAQYFMMDRNLGVFAAMRASKDESKLFTGPVLRVVCVQALFGLMLAIPVLGWIAGAILSVMYYNAPAIRYEQITAALHGKTMTKGLPVPPAT